MSEIVVFGHPSLTDKSVNVENIDDYIISLTKKMIQIMYDAPGVGLAAPQIGINKNIFVFDAGDGPKVAINPKLEDLQGSVVFMEGCLSLPDQYADIERPKEITIEYIDEDKKNIIRKIDGYEARILQHEIDHLSGKLFVDYLSSLKRNILIKKVKKIQNSRKYND